MQTAWSSQRSRTRGAQPFDLAATLSSIVSIAISVPALHAEAHALHHARDVHAYNDSTLPIIDILFGTFRNPREFAEHAGFGNGASRRVVAMLLGGDVVSGE